MYKSFLSVRNVILFHHFETIINKKKKVPIFGKPNWQNYASLVINSIDPS